MRFFSEFVPALSWLDYWVPGIGCVPREISGVSGLNVYGVKSRPEGAWFGRCEGDEQKNFESVVGAGCGILQSVDGR